MGTDYWRGLVDWLRDTMVADGKIGKEDLALLLVTDNVEEAVQHILTVDAAG
jgi:predicted Rossmann-fold nucleotide-binding protein